ncbi:MAG: methylenetetrahydrofolate reductase [NAD(P)H] [Bacteroidetes bacterium]|nr:MAG: methylenetetrahydrofolate reductase [NAD(P)H] [Bacteroidota bacterium]
MKIIDHINSAEGTLFSFEILPPLKGNDIETLYQGIDPLMDFKPKFIDVTYHREEYVLRERPDGGFDKVATRKRPGTVGICAALMNKYQVDAVPHLICGGFSKEETENALIDLAFLGIDNVLALRGDNLKGDSMFVPEENGNTNALELVNQVKDMNQGIYLDDELKNANPTNFCIGVAGYPEKHQDAPNLKSDLTFLKKKIDAGAEFIVTQMFFDNSKYFEFVDHCRANGINVPIIPGLKPLATKKQLFILPKIFHIDLPEDLVDEVEKAKNAEQVKEAGIQWCIAQSKELKKAGVPVLHFYTMGKSEATYRVASEVF